MKNNYKIGVLIVCCILLVGCKNAVKKTLKEASEETVETGIQKGSKKFLQSAIKKSTRNKVKEIFPENAVAKKITPFKELNAKPAQLGKKFIANTAKKSVGEIIATFNLSVPRKTYEKLIDGKVVKGFISNFDKYALSSVKLPQSSYLLPDIEQFKIARKLLRDQFAANPRKIIDFLKKQNERIIKNDNAIFTVIEKDLIKIEKQILEAGNIKDLALRKSTLAKLDSERKALVKNMVNVQVTKGKPFKRLTPDEMLEKQINEITNSNDNTVGNIYGFQWHHSEKEGVMQLVTKDVHSFGANNHIGGREIWGGGVLYRKKKTSPLYNEQVLNKLGE